VAAVGDANKAKHGTRAKLVKEAKTTDRWCPLQQVPVTQEAKTKQRMICLINLLGEVYTEDNCGNKHPKVCSVPAHSKGKVQMSTCKLWHMRVPFAGSGPTQGRTQGNSEEERPHPSLQQQGQQEQAS
jgi:hypothetical protein